jgi:hypothetical protein
MINHASLPLEHRCSSPNKSIFANSPSQELEISPTKKVYLKQPWLNLRLISFIGLGFAAKASVCRTCWPPPYLLNKNHYIALLRAHNNQLPSRRTPTQIMALPRYSFLPFKENAHLPDVASNPAPIARKDGPHLETGTRPIVPPPQLDFLLPQCREDLTLH